MGPSQQTLHHKVTLYTVFIRHLKWTGCEKTCLQTATLAISMISLACFSYPMQMQIYVQNGDLAACIVDIYNLATCRSHQSMVLLQYEKHFTTKSYGEILIRLELYERP